MLKHILLSTKCDFVLNFFFFFGHFVFLGPHLWHMEVPRLGVESELQLLAYTAATATRDPSRVCDLHHSSQRCQILNLQSQGLNPQIRGYYWGLLVLSHSGNLHGPFILNKIPWDWKRCY